MFVTLNLKLFRLDEKKSREEDILLAMLKARGKNEPVPDLKSKKKLISKKKKIKNKFVP